MQFSAPGEFVVFTKHSQMKMRQYSLSQSRVKRILRYPKREEAGIARGTIAAMIPSGTKKRPSEIWMMYKLTREKKVKVISAWRYPGVTKEGEAPPIPQDILRELIREYGLKA